MTDEEFLKRYCKPGVTMEDFGKPMTEEQLKELKEQCAKLHERERKRKWAERQPLKNLYINI